MWVLSPFTFWCSVYWWAVEFISLCCCYGAMWSLVVCCSCWNGYDSWTAKTRHYPAGDEAGGWHGVRSAWCKGQVDLSSLDSRGKSSSTCVDSCVFCHVQQPTQFAAKKRKCIIFGAFSKKRRIWFHEKSPAAVSGFAQIRSLLFERIENGSRWKAYKIPAAKLS